jgi:hypothetical protein
MPVAAAAFALGLSVTVSLFYFMVMRARTAVAPPPEDGWQLDSAAMTPHVTSYTARLAVYTAYDPIILRSEGVLGRGSYGVVFRVRDIVRNDLYALKVVSIFDGDDYPADLFGCKLSKFTTSIIHADACQSIICSSDTSNGGAYDVVVGASTQEEILKICEQYKDVKALVIMPLLQTRQERNFLPATVGPEERVRFWRRFVEDQANLVDQFGAFYADVSPANLCTTKAGTLVFCDPGGFCPLNGVLSATYPLPDKTVMADRASTDDALWAVCMCVLIVMSAPVRNVAYDRQKDARRFAYDNLLAYYEEVARFKSVAEAIIFSRKSFSRGLREAAKLEETRINARITEACGSSFNTKK